MCMGLSDTDTVCVWDCQTLLCVCGGLSDTDTVCVWDCRTLTLYVYGIVGH